MHVSQETRPAQAPLFLVTCEHGGNEVPAKYQSLFEGYEALLASHRGHDPGALVLARELSAALDAPLIAATVTRLLIDLNRSPGHRALFSEATRDLPAWRRESIQTEFYLPYRQRVEKAVATAIAAGRRVVHFSSHSFTPLLAGRERRADVGLLYDPRRTTERALCAQWLAALKARAPQLRVRRNYPYTGRADGLCAWLRRWHPETDYVGIELEVNQRHVTHDGPQWRQLREAIVGALLDAVEAKFANDRG